MKNTFIKLKGGNSKMQDTQEKANKPDFAGKLNVAAWFNTDRNGRTYLSVVLGKRATLFPVEKEIEPNEIEDIFD